MSIITFPRPPKGFNPKTASHTLLAQHGFPRRPDAKTEPGLRRLWDRAFDRNPTFIEPGMVKNKLWHSTPRKVWLDNKFNLIGNWAGGIVQVSSLNLNPPEPATMVYAEWTVPAIQTAAVEPGQQIIGFWVGLGGVNSLQLLQAGTAAVVTGNAVNYSAWTEWLPNNATPDNLIIQAGDVVSVLVCAPQATQGYVSMMNQRTNQAISVAVADPQGATPYDGSTVEWIVESISSEMPNFGTMTFTEVTAGTQNNTIDLSRAFAINTISNGKTLATGKILGPQNDVQVVWNAAI